MAYFTDEKTISLSRSTPRFEPAWILLAILFAVLLSAAVWSDHVVDQDLEDWHGNVRYQGPDYRN